MYAKIPILTGKLPIFGNFTINNFSIICGKRENLNPFASNYVAMV